MSMHHKVAIMCDGCDIVIESSPDKFPTLILELVEEGWQFHVDVYANIQHYDFCLKCISRGTPELIRDSKSLKSQQ